MKFWESEEQKSLGLECYNLSDSISLADEFLLFQFNNNDECVSNFLNTLNQVLARKSDKSTNKWENWFFDLILTFMCSVGQINNAKEEVIFHQIIVSTNLYFILLMLFAGDPISDEAKYKSVW
jgi:hypothetical protein